jgi:hypothetical protein
MVDELITGSVVHVYVTLTKNKQTFTINPAAAVTANFRTPEGVAASSTVTCLSTTPGADWVNSKVVITFPSSVTDLVTPSDDEDAPPGGRYWIEVQEIPPGEEPVKWVIKDYTFVKGTL